MATPDTPIPSDRQSGIRQCYVLGYLGSDRSALFLRHQYIPMWQLTEYTRCKERWIKKTVSPNSGPIICFNCQKVMLVTWSVLLPDCWLYRQTCISFLSFLFLVYLECHCGRGKYYFCYPMKAFHSSRFSFIGLKLSLHRTSNHRSKQ